MSPFNGGSPSASAVNNPLKIKKNLILQVIAILVISLLNTSFALAVSEGDRMQELYERRSTDLTERIARVSQSALYGVPALIAGRRLRHSKLSTALALIVIREGYIGIEQATLGLTDMNQARYAHRELGRIVGEYVNSATVEDISDSDLEEIVDSILNDGIDPQRAVKSAGYALKGNSMPEAGAAFEALPSEISGRIKFFNELPLKEAEGAI